MPRITPEDLRRTSVEELRAAAAERLEELLGPRSPAEEEARRAWAGRAVAEELEVLTGRKKGGGGRRR